MGVVKRTIILRNACQLTLAMKVDALVDSAALQLCIPESLCARLQLGAVGNRPTPYAGPLEIRFENRVAFVGALVTGDEVRLGLIPMMALEIA